MTYEELKKIAQPHIREGEKLPSTSLLLLAQLHIPYKTDKQCEEDFKGRISPLKNTPAFLYIDSVGNRTLYFSMSTQYYNFYIFHEISHYLLGHEQNSPQNEIDADMLACILAAPIENLPSYLKSARDLSSLCQIPIDKAEMYWQNIKHKFFKSRIKRILIATASAIAICVTTILSLLGQNNISQTSVNSAIHHNNIIEETTKVDYIEKANTNFSNNSLYYMTSSGTHYHKLDCQHIKYKTNTTSVSLDEINKLNLEPCKKCIN